MSVLFPCSPEIAFRYLVEPRNRPQWQSSLRTVDRVTPGEPQVGMTWRDLIECSARPAPDAVSLGGQFDHRTRARTALMRAHRLTEWERGFLASIAERARPLTERQAATLAKIERKAGA